MRNFTVLVIKGIEATQATQVFWSPFPLCSGQPCPDNSVPLVAGRRTVLRVFVEGATPGSHVGAAVFPSGNGPPGFPALRVGSPIVANPQPLERVFTDRSTQVDFTISTPGTWDLVVIATEFDAQWNAMRSSADVTILSREIMTDTAGKLGPSTMAIHAGEGIDAVTRASSPNLAMSVTFAPDEVTGFSARNRANYEGFVYARLSNPTVKQLEDKLAALEGSESCQCYASGMAASHALMLGRLSQGDHLVISDTNYVGTAEFVRDSLPRFGIAVTPVDTSNPQSVADAIRPETKMVWIETPANPIMRLSDVATLAQLAHARGVRDVAVDSTFASPIGLNPIALGADFVIHSLTKYISGHGDAMGGAVLGRKADLNALNLEATVHFGGVLSPFNAWLIMRGAATLPIRMRAHQENAMKVAAYLETHPRVRRVFYPGLASHPQHELARGQMRNFSGMMTFQVEDGEALARRMVEKLEIIHYAVSLGHHRSLVYWIPTEALMRSTFRHEGDLLRRYRDYAGDGVFRFSIGLEDDCDICADLDRVL